MTSLEALIVVQRHSTNERKLRMASLESIIERITSMFYWLLTASNPQTTFPSYFFQVIEGTLHFSAKKKKKTLMSVLNSKRKTCDACRCGSLYKWFPRKFVVCKGKCELEKWLCPSVADVRRQTQSRHAALAVGQTTAEETGRCTLVQTTHVDIRSDWASGTEQAGSSGNIPTSIWAMPISNTGRGLCWDFSLQVL